MSTCEDRLGELIARRLRKTIEDFTAKKIADENGCWNLTEFELSLYDGWLEQQRFLISGDAPDGTSTSEACLDDMSGDVAMDDELGSNDDGLAVASRLLTPCLRDGSQARRLQLERMLAEDKKRLADELATEHVVMNKQLREIVADRALPVRLSEHIKSCVEESVTNETELGRKRRKDQVARWQILKFRMKELLAVDEQ